ncbi:DNA-(apurinic or apyrimidinic site) lyase 2 isoform X3 [Brachypodium distachyon]|uniref:DNA-(apurinic or apyrimidinic site) lyase 2 isoform X3 n=1 Tax=Brachypodium distachyon TaxID=15368 RepID=UPI00071E54AC|nr:DNA-(apurinic or apyrimidinic site) lyase 2 isoform X3 [Brachypodium distachyon]|eukprot:XP_014758525.1 DNA-(apurinic or apyrimidinic site) lyase 2 isoform X3 [Brachypodium distachyon]
MVKIVTYNVNGLRPRVAQHGSLRRLLDALDADIICFQETKLSRQDLSGDVIMAEGYEAFISCNRTLRGRGAYSGVATFCRVTSAFSCQEVALPVAAEEGFTGLQGSAEGSAIIGDFVLEMPVEEEGLGVITREELLRVDNEGRCIITDHGHFVLFNIYGPAVGEDDEERVRFKLLFYKILQKRWDFLLALGKRVFVVGDMNIAPGSIDRCDAPPGFEKQMVGAYTCFNQKVGAEEYNYGSRIDHILISGACFHHCNSMEDHSVFHCHVEDCEIMNHFRRGDSENISKWKGGRSIKLEGSDHIPVYIILNGIPEVPVHNTPSTAARYLPEIRGRQQTIVSFLLKGKNYELEDATGSNMSKDRIDESSCSDDLENKSISKEELPTAITEFSKGGNLPSLTCKRRNLDHWVNEGSSGNSNNNNPTLLAPQSQKASFSGNKFTSNKKNKHNLSSQPTIKSFFRQPETKTGDADINNPVSSVDTVPDMDELRSPKDDSLLEHIHCTAAADEDQDNSDIPCSQSTDKCNVATLEWQRIQLRMKTTLPLCKGHREPCIPRSVKKGSNIGRLFYVCARAQGPSSNPEANCGHFQWASVKSKGQRQ